MQLPESLQIKVALYFTLFCGVGFALFLPFRCVTTLLVPTLFGYHGRTYVQTYLVTYMLSGRRRPNGDLFKADGHYTLMC